MNLSDIDEQLDETLGVIEKLINPYAERSRSTEAFSSLDSLISGAINQWLSGDEVGAFRTAQQVFAYLPHKLSRIAPVVEFRWQANLKALEADYESALKLGEEALIKARSLSVPGWLTRDILLDLRNIEQLSAFINGNGGKSRWQKQLLRLKRQAMVPKLDRVLSNAFEHTLKEIYEVEIDLPNTIRFGSNVNKVLELFSYGFAYATCLGSYTYFYILRERLSEVLYHYSRKFKNAELVVNALMLTTLQGKIKQTKKLVYSEWDLIYPIISERPLELINFPVKYNNYTKNLVMKCTLIELCAPYIKETYFLEIEDFLYEAIKGPFSMIETEDLKRSAVRATKTIIRKCHVNNMLLALIEACENIHVQDEVFYVFLRVNWDDVEYHVAQSVINFITNPPFNVINDDIRYAILVNIGLHHSELIKSIQNSYFEELLSKESPNGIYLSLTYGDLSEDDISSSIEKIINKGERENERFTRGSSITIGGPSWVYTLSVFLRHGIQPNWEKIIKLFYDVLTNHYQTEEKKFEILDTVCHLGNTQEIAMTNLLSPLAVMIRNDRSDIIEARRSDFLSHDTGALLDMALSRLDLIIGNFNQEQIIAKAVEYGNGRKPEVKKESLKLIDYLIQYKGQDDLIHLCPYLYSISFDYWNEIRSKAIQLLSKLSVGHIHWEEVLINKLSSIMYESSPMVRARMIDIASKMLSYTTSDICYQSYNNVLYEATRDSHYEVRDIAYNVLNI